CVLLPVHARLKARISIYFAASGKTPAEGFCNFLRCYISLKEIFCMPGGRGEGGGFPRCKTSRNRSVFHILAEAFPIFKKKFILPCLTREGPWRMMVKNRW
ncbi:MAG: hypothetical protein LUH45_07840, partial [Clostridiales bacterium]|nr:hypothetical protein [Clostridiales bacterium]